MQLRSRIEIGMKLPIWKKWIALAFVLVGMTVFAAGCGASSGAGPYPKAAEGVFDLRDWDWSVKGPVPLNGEWGFEWKAGARGKGGQPVRTTVEVPGTWGSTVTGDGAKLKDQGYGIYFLKIMHRTAPKPMMAIRIPNISTAYELYIDGRLAFAKGRVGKDARTSSPSQVPATVYFEAVGASTDLKMIVSNYDHRRGGIRTDLVIGQAEQIQQLQIRHAAQELIVFGCLIMIGFYHFGLFILRRKDYANLFFALLCLFVALRMGLMGECFVVQWFPMFNWELATRTEYIAFALSGWAGFGYFQRMFPGEIRNSWFIASSWCAAALMLMAATLPSLVFTSWIIVFQLYILLFSVVAMAAMTVSGIRRRQGARLALTGMAGLVVTIVNDVLFYNGWWDSVDLVPLGLLFLIVMNSFIISLRFSQTYERAELLSSELTELNSSLEKRISERTDELHRSYVTLADAKQELERMEASRNRLVSNISHDLRTPMTLLQGYLEALRDDVITEKSQRDATIRLMLAKVGGLNAMIQDLFELSVLEARKVELVVEERSLAEWRDWLVEQYSLEMREKGISFHCFLTDEDTASATVLIDVQRMNRVFANLLYNAMRYTPEGGRIDIEICALLSEHAVRVAITDSGDGIHVDDLPYIFDRFYKKDKSRQAASGGSGLGLSIAKEIVELHGGSIRATQPPHGGKGSRFEITMPMPQPAAD